MQVIDQLEDLAATMIRAGHSKTTLYHLRRARVEMLHALRTMKHGDPP